MATTWEDIKQKYGSYISAEPTDDQTFRATLHTFYPTNREAERALNKISDEIAARLAPVKEGASSESGVPKYHVVHEGHLSGKQIKEYLITVCDNEGEIFEVLL